MARKPLGRGLSALLGEPSARFDDAAPDGERPSEPHELDISLIAPNPEQPRTNFEESALEELASSIRSNGIVQPIVVRKKGEAYQIVAGERRWRAAQRAGLTKVPVTVKEVSDDKILEIALIENIQREELNPIEEALAYRKLNEKLGLTQEQVAERVGKERSLIATALRLLKLPAEIQKLISDGKISAGHGRALLLCDDRVLQLKIARAIIDKKLSVRETEKQIKKGKLEPITPKASNVPGEQTVDPNVRFAETKLMRALGTNVKIKLAGKEGGGRVEIEFYSNDDLDRIFRKITQSEQN